MTTAPRLAELSHASGGRKSPLLGQTRLPKPLADSWGRGYRHHILIFLQPQAPGRGRERPRGCSDTNMPAPPEAGLIQRSPRPGVGSLSLLQAAPPPVSWGPALTPTLAAQSVRHRGGHQKERRGTAEPPKHPNTPGLASGLCAQSPCVQENAAKPLSCMSVCL